MGSLPNKLYSEQVICLSLGIVESSVYLYSVSIAMAHNVLILLYNGRYSIHICTIFMAIIRRQWRKCCTTWSYLKIRITNFWSPTKKKETNFSKMFIWKSRILCTFLDVEFIHYPWRQPVLPLQTQSLKCLQRWWQISKQGITVPPIHHLAKSKIRNTTQQNETERETGLTDTSSY